MKRLLLIILLPLLMGFSYPSDCETFSFTGSLREDSSSEVNQVGDLLCAWGPENHLYGQVAIMKDGEQIYEERRVYYEAIPCKGAERCEEDRSEGKESFTLTRNLYHSSEAVYEFKSVSDMHSAVLYKDHAIIIDTTESWADVDSKFVFAFRHGQLIDGAKRLIDGAEPQSETPGLTFQVKTTAEDAEFRLRGGEWKPLEVGQVIPQGAEVFTGFDPIEFEISGGNYLKGDNVIKLDASTQMRLEKFTEFGSAMAVQIFLVAGKVANRINTRKGGGTDFSVKSPIMVASVEGTSFSVSYDPESNSGEVEVEDGTVFVDSEFTDDRITITGGQRVTVTEQGISTPEEFAVPASSSSAAWYWYVLGLVIILGVIAFFVLKKKK